MLCLSSGNACLDARRSAGGGREADRSTRGCSYIPLNGPTRHGPSINLGPHSNACWHPRFLLLCSPSCPLHQVPLSHLFSIIQNALKSLILFTVERVELFCDLTIISRGLRGEGINLCTRFPSLLGSSAPASSPVRPLQGSEQRAAMGFHLSL